MFQKCIILIECSHQSFLCNRKLGSFLHSLCNSCLIRVTLMMNWMYDMLLLFSRSSDDSFTQFAHTQIIFHHYTASCLLSTVFFFSWSHVLSQTASPFWQVKMPFNICYFWVFSCCILKLTRELFWPCPRPVSSLREGCYSFSALEIFLTALLAFVKPGLKKRTTSQTLQWGGAFSDFFWLERVSSFLGKQHYLDVFQEKHSQHKQLVWI